MSRVAQRISRMEKAVTESAAKPIAIIAAVGKSETEVEQAVAEKRRAGVRGNIIILDR